MEQRQDPTAVDLLEGETQLLRIAFEEWDASTADRYSHDTIAKFILEHLTLREAARSAVVSALGHQPATTLDAFGDSDRRAIRGALRRLSKMTEGTSAGELNFGQDFEGEIATTWELLRPELEAGPPPALPAADRIAIDFPSARFVRRHAPSRLRPEPQRWERYGPLVRFRSFYDHLRRAPAPAGALLTERLREAERTLTC